MINWNDIRVEQEIAQERYQALIEHNSYTKGDTNSVPLRQWLGTHLIAWGQKLQGSGPQQSSGPQLENFAPSTVKQGY